MKKETIIKIYASTIYLLERAISTKVDVTDNIITLVGSILQNANNYYEMESNLTLVNSFFELI